MIQINPESSIKIEWEDFSHNHSKEAELKIVNHISKKYGVDRKNIKVVFKPIKINANGEIVDAANCSVDNIMDKNYQISLMKEWIKINNKDVDFDRLLALDNKVNAGLSNDDFIIRNKKWSIKWIKINNFLSYGEDNFVDFSKLKKLTIVNGFPENQTGKSTLVLDAPRFLLYGTTTKTNINEQIFNLFTDKNELKVEGLLNIENEDIIIERVMQRSPQKSGGWNIKNKINYYTPLPNGERKSHNEEEVKKTTKLIESIIGKQDDFDLLVLATEKTLDSLIELKNTENGRLLIRLIGLEVLEKKEAIVKDLYSTFSKKMKSNTYNSVTLQEDIVKLTTNIQEKEQLLITLNETLETTKKNIESLKKDNDDTISLKIKIDSSITALNPSKLEGEIEEITNKGKSISIKITETKDKIKEFGEIIFDENKHHELTETKNKNNSSIAVKTAEINRLNKVIEQLISSGICQACNRKLETIDNTEHINTHQDSITQLSSELETLTNETKIISDELTKLNTIKEQIDKKARLELDIDRFEVEIGGLRNKIVSKKNELKEYKLHTDAIENNKKIDGQLEIIKTKLLVAERLKDDTQSKIQSSNTEIDANKKDIELKKQIIVQIEQELEIEKIYKIYIELIGKNGISKLVLRSVVPIINAELKRILDEVCDFDLEMVIDDKNEIKYIMTKEDGISQPIKAGSGFEKTAASLALRAILGKMSTLPTPNFIVFDEVTGKIANSFLNYLKPLLDKIKEMYDIVFFITHNEIIKDFGDSIITVVKNNHISKVNVR